MDAMRCNSGPYLYEHIQGRGREGIGMVHKKILETLLLARIADMHYILNHEWFDSEHFNDYSEFFDFDSAYNCTHEDLMHENSRHVIIVDIHVPDEHEDESIISIGHFCNMYKKQGYVNMNELSQLSSLSDSIFKQLVDTSNLRSNSTVFVLHRTYDTYLNGGKFTDWDCLHFFRTAFYNKLHFDLINSVSRFTRPSDTFIVVIHLRYGDSHIPMEETGVFEALQIAQILLHSNESFIKDIPEYIVYFISESSHEIGEYPTPKPEEFDFIKGYFPSEKLRIRIDHEQWKEDFDLITNPDLLIIPRISTFVRAYLELLREDTILMSPIHSSINWSLMLSNPSQALIALNMQYCRVGRIIPSLTICHEYTRAHLNWEQNMPSIHQSFQDLAIAYEELQLDYKHEVKRSESCDKVFESRRHLLIIVGLLGVILALNMLQSKTSLYLQRVKVVCLIILSIAFVAVVTVSIRSMLLS